MREVPAADHARRTADPRVGCRQLSPRLLREGCSAAAEFIAVRDSGRTLAAAPGGLTMRRAAPKRAGHRMDPLRVRPTQSDSLPLVLQPLPLSWYEAGKPLVESLKVTSAWALDYIVRHPARKVV